MLRAVNSTIATLVLFGLFQTPSTQADHRICFIGSFEEDGTITVVNPKQAFQLQQIIPGASKSHRYDLPMGWNIGSPLFSTGNREYYSFRTSYDCYWLIAHGLHGFVRRIPKEDLKAFDLEAGANSTAIKQIRKKYRRPFSLGYSSTFDWYLNPIVVPSQGPTVGGLGVEMPRTGPPFAFLPTGSHSGKLFMVGRVWHVKATWDPKKQWWKTRFKDEERTDIYSGDVFAKGDSYYFLRWGTLSRMPIKADKDGLRKAQSVWAKKGQSIVAAITDAKKDTTYFFGNVDKKKSYVFELSKSPRLRYFARPIDVDRPALAVVEELSKRLREK